MKIKSKDSALCDDCFACQAISKMMELGRTLTLEEEQQILEQVHNAKSQNKKK